MLNRVLNLARRQKPQAFPPRKRAMAGTCYGQERLPELDAFAPAGDDHAGDPGKTFTDREPRSAPAFSGARAPTDEPRLAIDRMTVSIEDGLVMVFGPDRDPVPPQVVVRAAAEQPEAAVALPDGTTVVARRLAMVLQAQTLGRLGAAEDGGWIMTMLQGRDWPEMASERDLKTEQEPGAIERRGERLRITTGAGAFLIVDARPEPAGAALGLFVSDGTPISVVGLVGLLCEGRDESKAIGAPQDALVTAGEAEACGDPAELDLSGCSIRTDADGVWFDSPALAAVGGRMHLARWATRAPNGPVVSVSLTGGGTASLDLCAALEMACGTTVDHDPPCRIDDADGGSDGPSRLDLACSAARVGEIPKRKPDDAPGRTAPDIALTRPAFPRLELDSASVIMTDESALDLSFLDAVDAEPALTLDGLFTDLPEVALRSTGAEPCESGGKLAHDLPNRSLLDPLDSAPGGAGVTVPRAESEASQTTVVGRRTKEALSVATTLPPSLAGGCADEIDPESIVLVMVRGVPDGARLSAGIRDDDGSWSLSPLDLSSVTIMPPGGSTDVAGGALDGELIITGIALTDDGALAALSETVPLADYLSEPAAGETVVGPGAAAVLNPAGDCSTDPRPGAIALEVDPRIWDGEEFDALVIRDLPEGAGLSAGAYDPTIDGWVLMPQDLKGLTISPPADQPADFTLTLMGIVLRPGDTSAARVLTRLPVTLVEPLPGSLTAPRRDR